MYRVILIMLILFIGSAANCMAEEELSVSQAIQEVKNAILTLRMRNSNSEINTTSYTVLYKHRGVNSEGFLTECPFWVPESIGDADVLYYEVEGRITIAFDGNTLYVDDKVIRVVGTKDDRSTKSMSYITPVETRIWRYSNGIVYQNTKEGLIFDNFTNTKITSDTTILNSILYSNVIIPNILSRIQKNDGVMTPDILDYDFPNLKIKPSSMTIDISFDMPQKLGDKNLRMRYVIDLTSNTLLRDSVLIPPYSTTSLITDKYYSYRQINGLTFLAELRYGLPNEKYLERSLIEWKLEGTPIINQSVIIPKFTTAPLVSRFQPNDLCKQN